MNKDDQDRMKKLLQQTLPPVKGDSEPRRDLWPAMLRRLDARAAAPALACFNGVWFDGALAAGLVALIAFSPASIPVILYYL
jgi:anti-sigma factor RsiW